MKPMLSSSSYLLVFVILFSSCNMDTSEPDIQLDELTIADIHQAYQNGDYTAEQLTQAYIDRINEFDLDSTTNAIVLINPQALEDARRLDEEFKNTGALKPLHGIPVIVKDNYNTKDLQTTAGSAALAGFEPSTDAYQVKKLREAGAIILAKSNMAEWAFSPRVTISSLAGETRNPYNLNHTTAGSSGGTGAAVAANFGAVGLGTDTGNSIRGPSSHNALVGFRSTLGLTSREGIAPLYLRNDVGGPMCRTVEDATRILQLIAGYDPNDPVTSHAQGKVAENYLNYLDEDGLQGARIGVLRTLSEDNPHPEVKSLFEQAISDLSDLGATIIDPLDIPGFDELRQDQWCSMFQHDVNAYLASLGPDVPVKNLSEVIESGKYADYIESRLNYHLENGVKPGEGEKPCLDPFEDPRRIAYRKAIEKTMDSLQLDAIIYPSWNHPPAKIGDQSGYKGDNSQVIAPHTGQPAFTVPMGYTTGNLPAGLQFLGRIFDEPTLIKLTYAYEQGTQHRKPPSAVFEAGPSSNN
jgi:amidase